MSSFTIFILLAVLVAGAYGWFSGLLKQVGQIAGVVLGILACRLCGDMFVMALFGAEGAENMLYKGMTYTALFLAVYIAVWTVVKMMRKVVRRADLGFLDKLAGALFRITEWMLILSLALNVWQMISPENSLIGDPMYDRVLWFGPWLLGTDAATTVGGLIGGALAPNP